MLKMYYRLPNGKSFAHVSRSCTSTLCAHALKNFWPDKYNEFMNQIGYKHSPQRWMEETWANRLAPHCLVMVRNPIDRLNSLISRNNYTEEVVDSVLLSTHRYAIIKRETAKQIDIVKFHHIAPVCWIADNDSQLCLFPNVKQACEILDMEYDPTIYENKLDEKKNTNFKNIWIDCLKDSIGLWEALENKTF